MLGVGDFEFVGQGRVFRQDFRYIGGLDRLFVQQRIVQLQTVRRVTQRIG